MKAQRRIQNLPHDVAMYIAGQHFWKNSQICVRKEEVG